MSPLRPTLYPHPIIGWREYVRLPELAVGRLIAKIDTGARSAALHAEDILIEGKTVSFTVVNGGKRYRQNLALIGQRRVKSTSGHSENRAVIETVVTIGEHELITEMTLTNRTDMGVPMLLGRNSLGAKFLVHPARTFLLSKTRIKKKKPHP
jgi:hypothetical protein